jgi:hypothetical protein
MAKKEYVKITKEGLNLLTILNYSSIGDINGFYGKEVFLSAGFAGDVRYLFQSLGNLGAHPRSKDLDVDVSIIVISNKILTDFESEVSQSFVEDMDAKLNQNNSAYRRVKFISEAHLIGYLENRINSYNNSQKDKELQDLLIRNKYKPYSSDCPKDELLQDLVSKYRESCKTKSQQSLF